MILKHYSSNSSSIDIDIQIRILKYQFKKKKSDYQFRNVQLKNDISNKLNINAKIRKRQL